MLIIADKKEKEIDKAPHVRLYANPTSRINASAKPCWSGRRLKEPGMTYSRLAAAITIACFTVGLCMVSPFSWAADLMIREAATPTGPSPAVRSQDELLTGRKGSQFGLAPIPFKPEPSPRDAVRSGLVTNSGLADIRGLVKKVNRSVVSIRMLDSGTSWSLGSFGLSRDEPDGKAMGYGSGFIVSPQGHIVTNEHVLRNGSKIEVELLDGRKYFARVLKKDGKNDLALLKIDSDTELFPVELGNSEEVELGEWVVGIGNPYGIGQSLMMGIVSANNRKIPGSGYPPLIQIDAAMNLGNSGGPLFNLKGQVVGINTILLWKSQGIGFATPINVAKRFLGLRATPIAKSDSSAGTVPFEPASDKPRSLGRAFNPFDPPWKVGR